MCLCALNLLLIVTLREMSEGHTCNLTVLTYFLGKVGIIVCFFGESDMVINAKKHKYYFFL